MFRDENSFFAQLFNHTQSFVALYKPGVNRFEQVNRFGIDMFEMQDANQFSAFFDAGKLWSESTENIRQFLSDTERSVRLNGQVETEARFNTNSGRTFWGLLRVDILDINGEEHFLVKITNIDALKNAAFNAIRDAQQFKALFDNSTIGVVITNDEGKIVNFNRYAEKQFDYTREEVLGKEVELLIPGSSRKKHHSDKAHFMQHPQNRVMGAGRDLFALRKGNAAFPVEISLSHYEADGQHFVIAFVIDISVRKKSEELVLEQKAELETKSSEIEHMYFELEKKVEDRTRMLKETLVELQCSKDELRTALVKEKELGELKSRFVTMASHEFRTPLSTILSSCYIIQQYTTTEDQPKRDRHLAKIHTSVQDLTFILEDFLSLEKLEMGQVHVNFQLLSGSELMVLLEDMLGELKSICKSGQILQLTAGPLVDLSTDKQLLKNILVNLVSNAIKYSPADSRVNIHAAVSHETLAISVSDRGMGIPTADQKHLFERFFRATNAGNIQGTGLGLHIVNRYLHLIGGNISVQSTEGSGSTFTIRIPFVS